MKTVLDTNVVIGFLRNRARKDAFESRTVRPQLYMSSVVVMELYAGCRTKRHTSHLDAFLEPFEKAKRLITPDHGSFREAGRVLEKLGVAGLTSPELRQITNDVLIAVSALRAGAVVLTSNVADFSRIASQVPVRWLQPDSEWVQ